MPLIASIAILIVSNVHQLRSARYAVWDIIWLIIIHVYHVCPIVWVAVMEWVVCNAPILPFISINHKQPVFKVLYRIACRLWTQLNVNSACLATTWILHMAVVKHQLSATVNPTKILMELHHVKIVQLAIIILRQGATMGVVLCVLLVMGLILDCVLLVLLMLICSICSVFLILILMEVLSISSIILPSIIPLFSARKMGLQVQHCLMVVCPKP